MMRIWIALATVMAGFLAAPAQAVPPTVTPSPGYDARLQESRRGSATMNLTPAPGLRKAKPRKKPRR